MALFKISDRHPNYREQFFGGDDIKGTNVYSSSDESDKVGSVHDILVDETGRIRYLIVDVGFWIFGKRVLLPIGRCIDDPRQDSIYATNLTKDNVEHLPAYSDDMVVDYRYEEQVRSVYRMPSVETTASVEMSAPVEQTGQYAVRPNQYDYDQDSTLYGMNDANHRRLRLYEERLVASKTRKKTGSVKISKRIETEPTETSVTIRREIIVIEIESVQGATRVNTPDGVLQDGGVVSLDMYEEQENFQKEPVVYQEVNIRKEIKTDVVNRQETLRREELDIYKKGEPPLDNQTR